MENLVKTFLIKHRDFIHAGKASIEIKNILKALNTPPDIIRRVAVCGYEGEMNVVMHAQNGRLNLELSATKIVICITDKGPGIEDIEQAMQVGFSTAPDEFREMGFGAGMGLPNMKKNADRFEMTSIPGEGTTIKMEFKTGDRK
ncbi:RsbW2 [Desulforapulum autotrophicum HRM2]|uniref:RsbW2 n=1 Tax=Desulforapulum autotrophicum (strain ATCC 43914 / DSM 3382 / VKM B-1955 / HRM2) TaxID=177437 RepID=C0QAH9_DESAH|nr:ATP-binding protein [Desulforapulum autotrophicum]ACN14764.1 RsbW2 [Desulforapulum autotrophicum HRM2]